MPPLTNIAALAPLDDTDPQNQPLLDDVQCNILSSHDRPNTDYFFLTFSGGNQARQVLKALALGNYPNGAALESEWLSRGRRRTKATLAPAARFAPLAGFSPTLMLSARCYPLLQLAPPGDLAFRQGMAGRDRTLQGATKLNDPPNMMRGSDIHALYAISYDAAAVDSKLIQSSIKRWLQSLGVIVQYEQGYVLRHTSGGRVNAIEPFGYRDAISQPLFYAQDLQVAAKYQGKAATAAGGAWSSFAPLSLVLVADPHGTSAQPHGTYVAYRKIRQKVDHFYKQAAALAAQAPQLPGGVPLKPNDVADQLIGRRVDGTPLDPSPDLNDFVYPNNSACPIHAHARKVNPRDVYARPHRIARRSTVYGAQLKRDGEGRPTLPTESVQGESTPEVGLLFFCCQAEITQQFEFLQAQWANDARGGADTVIGQLPPQGRLNQIALNGSFRTLAYSPVTEVLAGDYFFVPSISFFSTL